MILENFDVLAQAEACQRDNANEACCAEKLCKRNGQSGSWWHVQQSEYAYYRYGHKPIVQTCEIYQYMFFFETSQ
jgi:hypothetical protein